ncbi:MAG: MMPL family transporter, partial [Planctomycetaceae bacterium]|nr:MMPL family transporter [Planctomycetaceae bacterium]
RYQPPASGCGRQWLERFAMRVVNHPVRVLVPMLTVTLLCAVGLRNLESLIDPLEFLPGNDRVLKDTLQVKENLTSPTSIEVMVDFSGENSSFATRLKRVQQLEVQFNEHPNVCHTLSLADFFPEELSEQNLSPSRLAASAGNSASSSLLADGYRLWRISVRLQDDSPRVLRKTMDDLKASTQQPGIIFTGLGPLLEEAQGDIFDGFWSSFMSAFLLISVVMILALRSPVAGVVAMIPNLTPIMLVFGILGWSGIRIDIGIMMTASIALGLAVDGTFHFLFSYQSCIRTTRCRYRAVRRALLHTGGPIISSAIISGTGLLALGLSPFRPTMKFGVLMFVLLMTALIGDLILLPALLAVGTRRRRISLPPNVRAIVPYRSSRAA